MRSMKLATFTLLGLASSVALASARSLDFTASAQAGDGTVSRSWQPRSSKASNIVPSDTYSIIAPELPPSPAGPDAAPADYLQAARDALTGGRTGEAQQSLEMAETRILSRAVDPDAASRPIQDPAVLNIRSARLALGHGDRARAIQFVSTMTSDLGAMPLPGQHDQNH